MLRSGAFWLGVGAGAIATVWMARRRGRLIAATPYYPRAIRRTPRRGGAWAGRARDARSREGRYG